MDYRESTHKIPNNIPRMLIHSHSHVYTLLHSTTAESGQSIVHGTPVCIVLMLCHACMQLNHDKGIKSVKV